MIHTEAITRCFGNNLAVDGVTVHVHQGEVFGFLGANGGYKTTDCLETLDQVERESEVQAQEVDALQIAYQPAIVVNARIIVWVKRAPNWRWQSGV